MDAAVTSEGNGSQFTAACNGRMEDSAVSQPPVRLSNHAGIERASRTCRI